MYSSCKNGTIKSWKVVNNKIKEKEIGSHKGWVFCLAFDQNNQILYSAGQDKTIKSWEVVNGKIKEKEIGSHEGSVNCLVFD